MRDFPWVHGAAPSTSPGSCCSSSLQGEEVRSLSASPTLLDSHYPESVGTSVAFLKKDVPEQRNRDESGLWSDSSIKTRPCACGLTPAPPPALCKSALINRAVGEGGLGAGALVRQAKVRCSVRVAVLFCLDISPYSNMGCGSRHSGDFIINTFCTLHIFSPSRFHFIKKNYVVFLVISTVCYSLIFGRFLFTWVTIKKSSD